MGAFAWVTLATNDSYSLGALVLAHSLKQAGTAHQLAVLVTPGVTNAMREKLASVFNVVEEVNILDSRDQENLRLLKRPELGITFTKLHCWRLTQFEKCVFLDADTLMLQNSDELFERDELSAAPDVGWPDCFNSGVYVYRPSLETYEKLIQFALEKGSFDGGDQGLLNLYFSDWAHKDISKHLPFIYNMCSTACYSYLPAFKQFGANAKIIHFIGAQKPWLQYFNTETRKVQPSGDSSHLQEVLQRWWDIFCSLIYPQLSPEMQGQSQHEMSPSYFPPQYDPPPNPTTSADENVNTWDPWDEYDQKLAQNIHYALTSTHYNHNQHIQSINTNASMVTDQHKAYSHSQNNSYYPTPPPQANDHVTRVPTPPPSPQPNHYNQASQFHHDDSHHQNTPHSETQYQHHEPQSHHFQPQSHNRDQHHVEPQHHHHFDQYKDPDQHQYHNEHHDQHHNHDQHQHHDQQHQVDDHKDNTNNDRTYCPHNHKVGHAHTSQSSSPERPRSPNQPDQIPILPKECEATTNVSNETSLNKTIEDSSRQEDAGLAGAFAQLTLGVARTPQQDTLENILRKQAWEVGNIDYLGRDSFDNIWSQISKTLSVAQSQAPAPAPEPEVPSAPTAIQSQTAPQEEAIFFEPLVPTDTPTDIVSSIDTSIKSSPPVEPEKEISQASESLIIAPEVPVTSTAEVAAAASNIEVPTSDVSQKAPQKTPVAEPLICPRKEVAIEHIAPEPTPVPADLPYETKANVLTEKAVEQHISSSESQKPIPPAQAPSLEKVATLNEPLAASQTSHQTPVISATETEEPQSPAKLDISTLEFDSAKPSAESFTIISSAVAPTLTSAVEKPAVIDTEPEVLAATDTPSAEPLTTTSSAVVPTLTSDVGKPAVLDTEPEVSAATETPSAESVTITSSAVAPILTSSVGIPAVMDTEPEVLAAIDTPAVISATKTEDSQIPAKLDIATPEFDSAKPSAEPVTSMSSTVAPTLTSAVGKPAVMDTESDVLKAAVAPPAISTLKEAAIPAAEKAEAVGSSSKAAIKDPKLDFAKPAATKSSPKTKVTAATPPASPGTPPVEKTKRALTAETKIPDTPPPSAAGSTPTPPPRKTDKPKKAAAKPKK